MDLTAVAEMNLFLPRDYSAVRARVTEAFTLRRLSAKIIGEIESITTLTAAIASGMGRRCYRNPLLVPCAGRRTAGWRGSARLQ